jgi:hypothetical protein
VQVKDLDLPQTFEGGTKSIHFQVESILQLLWIKFIIEAHSSEEMEHFGMEEIYHRKFGNTAYVYKE